MVAIVIAVIALCVAFSTYFKVSDIYDLIPGLRRDPPPPPKPEYLAPGVLWIPAGLDNFTLGIDGKIEHISTGGEPCLMYERSADVHDQV